MGSAEEVLCTLLGSCIGLALYDQQNQIGGLAHIVLPRARAATDVPGKFADTAIPELLRRIDEIGGNGRSVNARIAGGADMFNTGTDDTVGSQNLAAVEELLETRGIPVTGRHCGGEQGRRVSFEVESGRVFVEQVGVEGRIEI